jgi:hypothetical protein
MYMTLALAPANVYHMCYAHKTSRAKREQAVKSVTHQGYMPSLLKRLVSTLWLILHVIIAIAAQQRCPQRLPRPWVDALEDVT